MDTFSKKGLPPLHFLAAISVVAVWGTNFVVASFGLEKFPPFTFAALRFLLASVPLLLFVNRPALKITFLMTYGFLAGVGQFGLMLYALNGHIAPGLASILVQTQAFLTVILAVLFDGERLRRRNVGGLVISAIGVGFIAWHVDSHASLLGLGLIFGSAWAWAFSNTMIRKSGPIDALGLVVWGNLYAVPPLTLAAIYFDRPSVILASLQSADGVAWLNVAWQAFANALFGYTVWNWLISRHSVAQVAPLGLMIPLFGLGASAVFLGETMPAWKLIGAASIIVGLAINLTGQLRPVSMHDSKENVEGATL